MQFTTINLYTSVTFTQKRKEKKTAIAAPLSFFTTAAARLRTKSAPKAGNDMPSGAQRPLWQAVDQLRSHRLHDSADGFTG